MIVRKAAMGDRQAMVEILNAVISIGGTTAYEDPLSADHFDQMIASDDPKTVLHVALADGEVVGLQWVKPLDPPDDDTGSIATFAKPATTQRGIGAALFQSTKAQSLKAGYVALVAQIRGDNTGGLAYYAKMGFEDYDVVKAVPLKDGTPVDRVVKRMVL